ncbi:hypothetical protein J6590_071708 [Homalodisca vitripennis]|nr:hypothetical protein J6590_071708 [Homalodisca vitripennis]
MLIKFFDSGSGLSEEGIINKLTNKWIRRRMVKAQCILGPYLLDLDVSFNDKTNVGKSQSRDYDNSRVQCILGPYLLDLDVSFNDKTNVGKSQSRDYDNSRAQCILGPYLLDLDVSFNDKTNVGKSQSRDYDNSRAQCILGPYLLDLDVSFNDKTNVGKSQSRDYDNSRAQCILGPYLLDLNVSFNDKTNVETVTFEITNPGVELGHPHKVYRAMDRRDNTSFPRHSVAVSPIRMTPPSGLPCHTFTGLTSSAQLVGICQVIVIIHG